VDQPESEQESFHGNMENADNPEIISSAFPKAMVLSNWRASE
jgi:hypothetical protein